MRTPFWALLVAHILPTAVYAQQPKTSEVGSRATVEVVLRHSVADLKQALERAAAMESMPAGPGLSLVASSLLSTMPGDRTGRRDVDAISRLRLRPRMVALIAMLELYAEQPTDELAANIAGHLDALAGSPEAKPLVDAVRGYYGHANVWVDVSEDLLDAAVEGAIDRWDPIDTIILGTPVTGKGKIEAVRTLEIEPRANEAVLKIVVDGVINGNTVGRRGAAEIASRTLTTFRTEKSLVLCPNGLELLPTVCEARTQTIESSVTAKKPGLRGRILERVARRRSQELRSAADEESSQQARRRLLKAVDDEAETLVKRLNCAAILPMLLIAHATGGGQIEIYSERRVLRIGAIVGALGAPPGRPPCEERRLVALRVHESLARRYVNRVVADDLPARLANQFDPAVLLGSIKNLAFGSNAVSWSAWPAREQQRSQILALGLVRSSLGPQLTSGGVTLRKGRWGTILPVSLTGEWWAAEWRPSSALERVAGVAGDRQER